ncbi:MAG: mechanosensitive ion channel family protein [Chloroflexi bacterium]|nr:MAG: mechanosensitive ion channel family protein [Chloroflexota bacterium]
MRRGTMRLLERRRAHSNAVILLGNLGQLAILTVGALIILAIFTGPNFGAILTSFSILGLVIGLSLQDILKNFFAGVWILVERPFRIGDTIQVDVHTGTVEQIAFRTTMLRTPDGRQVVLPNNTLMTMPVVNHTAYPVRRGEVWVVLPEDATPADVVGTVRAALADVSVITPDPAPRVELRGVDQGRMRFLAMFWAPDRDQAVPEAIAALRARLPKAEVHGA